MNSKAKKRMSTQSTGSVYNVETGLAVHPDVQTWPEPDGFLKLRHKDCAGFTMTVGHAQSLGDGAYGKVCRGVDEKTGLSVAVKVVPMDGSDQDEAEVGQEVMVLEQHSRHVNIARFFGAYRKRADMLLTIEDELWLAMELCAYGTASNLVLSVREPDNSKTAPSYLPESAIVYLAHGMLTGIEYLHKRNVLHRDIK
eukprot:gene13593-24323_t